MTSIPRQLLLQVILILLNAFFAAAEIAVVSLNGTKLRRLEEEGDKKAGRLLKLVEEPASFLSTIQVGITMAGFLGSAFAADNFSEYLVKVDLRRVEMAVHDCVELCQRSLDLGFSIIPLHQFICKCVRSGTYHRFITRLDA